MMTNDEISEATLKFFDYLRANGANRFTVVTIHFGNTFHGSATPLIATFSHKLSDEESLEILTEYERFLKKGLLAQKEKLKAPPSESP